MKKNIKESFIIDKGKCVITAGVQAMHYHSPVERANSPIVIPWEQSVVGL